MNVPSYIPHIKNSFPQKQMRLGIQLRSYNMTALCTVWGQAVQYSGLPCIMMNKGRLPFILSMQTVYSMTYWEPGSRFEGGWLTHHFIHVLGFIWKFISTTYQHRRVTEWSQLSLRYTQRKWKCSELYEGSVLAVEGLEGLWISLITIQWLIFRM